MCGIAGCLGRRLPEISEPTIDVMRQSILYRGRDEQDEWTDHQLIHLLHSRLSIIDLSSGQQPMWDHTHRYVIVYNGEIYNYKELRQAYAAQGSIFRTQSDTEIILEGFKLKGQDVCRDLNGMFAFAIWDTHNQELFLARDHLGKKPLFWCYLNGMFYFASTLEAFTGISEWTGNLSLQGQVQFGLLGNFLEDTTIYEQACSLPFASSTYVRLSQPPLKPTRYWNMDFSQKSSGSFEDLMAEYESLLTDAIAIRLNSDVPLAITYSGGVDSGTIAAFCSQKLNHPLTCYTIDYHTEDDVSEEVITAKRSAEYLGLDWHFIQYDYQYDLLDELAQVYPFYSEPCSQLALVYSHRLYSTIKPFATVVLSGNGADELFTGYIGNERTRLIDMVMGCLRWSRPLFRAFERATSTYLSPFFQMPINQALALSWQKSSLNMLDTPNLDLLEKQYQQVAEQMGQAGIDNFLDAGMYIDLTCSTNDANYRLPDISGLASQVEVRSPYLDYRMVEFAARLPHKFKVGSIRNSNYNKYLPKNVYSKYMLHDIAWGQKRGMAYNLKWHHSIRDNPVYRQTFADAYEALEQTTLKAHPFRQAWRDYCAGNTHEAGTMMSGFMFGYWMDLKQAVYEPAL